MRLKNIILTGLAHERLLAYDKLERVMNQDKGDISKIEDKIKKLLKKIATLNLMINEWESITAPALDRTQISNLINKKKDE
jgi:hypothetical protein